MLRDNIGGCGTQIQVKVNDATDGGERQGRHGLDVDVHAVAVQEEKAHRVAVRLHWHVERMRAVEIRV